MEEKKKRLKAKAIFKHELEVDWLKSSYVPEEGELVLYDAEIDENGNPLELPEDRTEPIDRFRFKFGNGRDNVSDLPFVEDPLIQMAEETLVPNMSYMDKALDYAIASGEYYISQHNLKTFFGDLNDSTTYYGKNRVYVERSRERGPYNLYSLNESGNKVYHFVYSKAEWLAKFVKEHLGEAFREPKDDEYPLLNTIPQRTVNGDLLVPTTPSSDSAAISKKYLEGRIPEIVAKAKNGANTLLGYTPGEKCFRYNKTNNAYKSFDCDFLQQVSNGNYCVFESDIKIEIVDLGSAGIQFFFVGGAGWFLIRKGTCALDFNTVETSSRVSFAFDPSWIVNNYLHLRLETYIGSTSWIKCYINGKEIQRTSTTSAITRPSKMRLIFTSGFYANVQLIDPKVVIVDKENTDVGSCQVTNFASAVQNNGQQVENTFESSIITEDTYLTTKKWVNDKIKNFVSASDNNTNYDMIATKKSSNSIGHEYLLTKKPEKVPLTGETIYQPNCGYYKEICADKVVNWGADGLVWSNYLLDSPANTGITPAIISNTVHGKVLSLSKKVTGLEAASDKITFKPTGSVQGKKFVFETEFSWNGAYEGGNSKDWCARIRFVDGSLKAMTTDQECYLTFSNNNLGISTSAYYNNKNKLVSVGEWALLRIELVRNYLYVFVNDVLRYSLQTTSGKNAETSTLGGFNIEFRGYAQQTELLFNNSFCGAFEDTTVDRYVCTVPTREPYGNIVVPENPEKDCDAASKKYVDSKQFLEAGENLGKKALRAKSITNEQVEAWTPQNFKISSSPYSDSYYDDVNYSWVYELYIDIRFSERVPRGNYVEISVYNNENQTTYNFVVSGPRDSARIYPSDIGGVDADSMYHQYGHLPDYTVSLKKIINSPISYNSKILMNAIPESWKNATTLYATLENHDGYIRGFQQANIVSIQDNYIYISNSLYSTLSEHKAIYTDVKIPDDWTDSLITFNTMGLVSGYGNKGVWNYNVLVHGNNNVFSNHARVFGNNLISTSDGLVVGRYNSNTNGYFVVGVGSASQRKDAIVVDGTGVAYINGAVPAGMDSITALQQEILNLKDKIAELESGWAGTPGLSYTIREGTATCTGIGTATSQDIVVAKTYQGKTVTRIGYKAFKDKELNSIKLPDTIQACENASLHSAAKNIYCYGNPVLHVYSNDIGRIVSVFAEVYGYETDGGMGYEYGVRSDVYTEHVYLVGSEDAFQTLNNSALEGWATSAEIHYNWEEA